MDPDEYVAVHSAIAYFKEVSACLRRGSSDNSALLSRFTLPVLSWLDGCQSDVEIAHTEAVVGDNLALRDGEVIDSLLLSVQSLLGVCQNAREIEIEAREDYIRDGAQIVRRLSDKLGLDRVVTSIHELIQQLPMAESGDVRSTVDRVLPFLVRYRALVDAQVATHTDWTKALFKLNYTLCSIVQTVSRDGFCQPRDADSTKEDGDEQGAAEGAGFGEGTGDENVSKDIQEESQVEGLQGEDSKGDEKVERAEEGNAIEMSEDFGGEMQDVPEEGEEGDKDSEEGSDADLDEQIGDVDMSSENAVDEKLWGDEQGPENKGDSSKSNQDHSKEQPGESEMVAKNDANKPDEQRQDQRKHESDIDQNQEEDQTIQDNTGELPDEEPVGVDGAALDEHIQEADTLDLPEDMEMDQDDQKRDSSDDVDMGFTDEEPDEEVIESSDAHNGDPADEAREEDVSTQIMQEDTQDTGSVTENVEDTVVAQADTHAGDGVGSADALGTDSQSNMPESADGADQQERPKDRQGQATGPSQEQAQYLDQSEM